MAVLHSCLYESDATIVQPQVYSVFPIHPRADLSGQSHCLVGQSREEGSAGHQATWMKAKWNWLASGKAVFQTLPKCLWNRFGRRVRESCWNSGSSLIGGCAWNKESSVLANSSRICWQTTVIVERGYLEQNSAHAACLVFANVRGAFNSVTPEGLLGLCQYGSKLDTPQQHLDATDPNAGTSLAT